MHNNGPVQILILGGNVFLGRSIAEVAVARGHETTTFTRGASGSSPAGAVAFHGDRDNAHDIASLGGGSWDVVVDVARSPLQVDSAIRVLRAISSRYVFVSTTSVYADLGKGPLTSESPVVEPATGIDSPYPNLKVRCEQIVRNSYPDNHLIARPGLLAGPGDPTDRFTYWVERATRPGPILAPGKPQRRVRFTDVRDLASWIVHAIESEVAGTFNTVGPATRLTMAEFLAACLAVAGNSDTDLRWVPDDFLLAESVEPYTQLPLWVPELPELVMFPEADSSRAQAAGLRFRPTADTIADTLIWAIEHRDRRRQNGLSAERERQLLERWSSGTTETQTP